MTYGGFQRFDECQAYYKMKREQKEDDEKQAEFEKEVERQLEQEYTEEDSDIPDADRFDYLVNEE